MSAPVGDRATVADCLRVGTGFSQGDRNWIVEQFGTLDARLASFPVDGTELEVTVKDREAKGQKVTLECWIAGQPKIVTTSTEEDLRAALNDCRDDLRRKLNDHKTRQEPRRNRRLRDHGLPDPRAVDEGDLLTDDNPAGSPESAVRGD
ncbi:HPF/RaiA family ribosome-associated protein [Plantactinospora siamensis]|uniref:HPF/RaiA family ribosome-associated protein n=1 Tax=Plantactinospora siamensis TaxID=555372 RepID=A0ABV6P0F8_9ACTN